MGNIISITKNPGAQPFACLEKVEILY
jgi:hypothetical protein